jgi:hypothetical protein
MRHEEWLEFTGISQAIQSEDFLDAATAGRHGRIGFAVLVWSSAEQPDVFVPWTIIEPKEDVQRVVDSLGAARKQYGFDARMGNGRGATAYRGDDGASAARRVGPTSRRRSGSRPICCAPRLSSPDAR